MADGGSSVCARCVSPSTLHHCVDLSQCSLLDGEEVEFDIDTGRDGRTRAVNVTGPSGSKLQVHRRPEQEAAQV